MKSKDQILLEAAYDDIVAYAKKHNPNWDPKRPFTSGNAFQSLVAKKTEEANAPEARSKTKKKSKEPEASKEEEFDVYGDPVGNFRSIASPVPEEDHSASMMFVTNAELEKIYNADEGLFDSLFKDSEGASEENKGIVFRYIAPQIRQKMEQAVHSILNK
mgnify:CR=1 FL=1